MNASESKLFKLAEIQQGYFTTKQAIHCGYITQNHRYHVLAGTWIREHRGIYRLARFPLSPDGQYVLWSLWSRNRQEIPQGVFSHQTALSIHELSDVMPAKLHLTVPPTFRRSAIQPEVICLHRAILPPSDLEQRQGFMVTRPLRTIVDLLKDETESADHLHHALQQAIANGLITNLEIRSHPDQQKTAKGVSPHIWSK
jgi:predicted transcriptional regulator of viral defense system